MTQYQEKPSAKLHKRALMLAGDFAILMFIFAAMLLFALRGSTIMREVGDQVLPTGGPNCCNEPEHERIKLPSQVREYLEINCLLLQQMNR
jgi:hypothetical protein